jgi:hypothetical protein
LAVIPLVLTLSVCSTLARIVPDSTLFDRWKTGEIVDGFGEKTGEKYIYYAADEGRITDGKYFKTPDDVTALTVREIDFAKSRGFSFQLYEDGIVLIRLGGLENIQVEIKDAADQSHVFTGQKTNDLTTLVIPQNEELMSILEKDQILRIRVILTEYRTKKESFFQFELNTKGFGKAYADLGEQE